MYGPEAYGSYGICPLCNWEDDPVQLANPLTGGGANKESLHEYQQRALGRWPLGVQEIDEEGDRYRRDPLWRPLSDEEFAWYSSRTQGGRDWTFKGIWQVEECYWVRSPLVGGGPAAV
jgi:hypothetical protein